MPIVNRRQFVSGASTLALAGGLALPAIAQAKPKVVVVGGGPGGATVAKYVAREGGVDVTLVEPAKQFVTCFHSNLYLGGFRSWEVADTFLFNACIEVRHPACPSGRAVD